MALEYLSTGIYIELWPWKVLGNLMFERIEQCCTGLRWRNHDDQGNDERISQRKKASVRSMCCSWVEKNQPCPWTPPRVKSSGRSIAKFNKWTWNNWAVTSNWKMEKRCPWTSRKWAAVKSTLKPYPIHQTDGEIIDGDLFSSTSEFFDRFIVVCGDGEYIIYTAITLRNKSYGSAMEFVWSQDSSEYAVRDGNIVKLFKNFKEKKPFKPEAGVEGIFGGSLLGVRSYSGLAFYDWETLTLIRRIEIVPKTVRERHVSADSSSTLSNRSAGVKMASWSVSSPKNPTTFFVTILKPPLLLLPTKISCPRMALKTPSMWVRRGETFADRASGVSLGVEWDSRSCQNRRLGRWLFHLHEFSQSYQLLCRRRNRHNLPFRQVRTPSHSRITSGIALFLCRVMYLLGYVSNENRLYLGDKEMSIVSFELSLAVLEYQTAVMRKDFETADQVLPTVPKEQRTRVAHFLEKQVRASFMLDRQSISPSPRATDNKLSQWPWTTNTSSISLFN